MSSVCSAAVSSPEATAAFVSSAEAVSAVVSAVVSAEAAVVSVDPDCPQAVDRAQTTASANENCFNLRIKFSLLL